MTSAPQQSSDPRSDSALWTAPPPGPVSFSAAVPMASVARPRRAKWRAALIAVPALVLVAAASSIITAVAVGGHSTSGTGAQAAGSGKADKVRATVGTIASTHGSSWTLTTASGKSVSVELGADTAYGSKTDPSAASAFHAGSHVKITGSDQGSTITAKRVVLAPGKSGSANGNSTTS